MMRDKAIAYVVSLAVVLVLGLVAQGFAQTPAQTPADPFSNGQKILHSGIKNLIIRAAEKMPEEHYGFKPTPEVRSFGQLLGHVADA
ncbi:MAG: DinB family protein [Acidobacteria bacterium]|nr:MAG: DinB family protein [Acidobacteriota bacterium]